jgi:oligopeptide transport system ATP-binding protein
MDVCKKIDPIFAEQGPGHFVACHLYPGSGADTAEQQAARAAD